MANNEFTIPIPARLKNVAKGSYFGGCLYKDKDYGK